MTPFFFGRSPDHLFGVYRPAQTMPERSTGVVLCYPFGQEYMRAHRAFRQLSTSLARAGFHALRFDYYGTGDSAGDSLSASVTRWVDDARTAADELRETADVTAVAFIGLRLGAAVAALAASRRDDVSHLVLWDPVVNGGDYLTELLEVGADSHGHARTSVARDGVEGVMGFPVTEQFRAEVRNIDLLRVVQPPSLQEQLIIVSGDRPDAETLSRAGNGRTSHRVVHTHGGWSEVDDYGGVLIPVALMQDIVSHLSRVAA